MRRDAGHVRRRRIQVFVALVLGAILYTEIRSPSEYEPVVSVGAPVVQAATKPPIDSFDRLIREDPFLALCQAQERHNSQVKDYSCLMLKQELLPSGMSAEQEMKVLHRHQPYSVVMEWTRNAGLASRVIYVKDRWIDEDAETPEERDQALCQPGKVAQLFLKSIRQPIHGSLAQKTARRSIDEFGFDRTLDLLIKYCRIARERNELQLVFRGESHFDGRPVWVIRRVLPYSGEAGAYPDRIAEIYVDREYRVPVAVYCYSGDEMKPEQLLGKYEYRNIRFGIGLSEKDFDPATYGM